MNILKKHHGMNIVGQGGMIILFMLPSLIAAILAQHYFPQITQLPKSVGFLKIAGYVLIMPGFILWGTAVIQLLTGFSKGKLITNGAYGVVRNPIYASAVFFLLPACAMITLTWVYFVPAMFLYTGVMIFIDKEEMQLTNAFGNDYTGYMERVDRLVPFRKPVKNANRAPGEPRSLKEQEQFPSL